MINKFKGTYRFLSNFYIIDIRMNDLVYPSVEHAYQAAKTDNLEAREIISLTTTPGEAKRLGRQVTLRSDWEDNKLVIMARLVWQKFHENPNLKRLLLTTGNQTLIEGNTWGDTFWGRCNGRGDNHLGKILMMVREEI